MPSKQHLEVELVGDITSLYACEKQLGKGGTCQVMLVSKVSAQPHQQKELYALKELNKAEYYNEELFAKEIQLLQELKDNVHVLDFAGAYQTKDHYYLATAYCSGGTFLERVISLQTFSEQDAVKYIHTIISTVQYMHERNIVHRDLKLNNMVFDRPGDDGVLKIIDFGDSEVIKDDASLKELVGTIYYLPPEAKRLRKGWEFKAGDMWSIGVLCYILVSGRLPFSGASQSETYEVIKKGQFEWPSKIELSDAAKSFISRLLCKSTKDRMTAADALKHEWIADWQHRASETDLLATIKAYLRDFDCKRKLHRILMNGTVDTVDKEVLLKAFHRIMDPERTGQVSEAALCRFLVLNSNVNHKYNDAQQQSERIIRRIESSTNLELGGNKSIPISKFIEQVTLSISFKSQSDKENQRVNGDSKVDEDEDGYASDHSDLDMGAAHNTKVSNANISVAAFRDLLHNAAKNGGKKYKVDSLVSTLDKGNTGFISFQSIQNFSDATLLQTVSIDAFTPRKQKQAKANQ